MPLISSSCGTRFSILPAEILPANLHLKCNISTLTHRGIDPQIYFWRTSAGAEVDILVQTTSGMVPIEVKLSATLQPAMAATIKSFQKDIGGNAAPGYVVHPGNIKLPLGPNVTTLPFTEL